MSDIIFLDKYICQSSLTVPLELNISSFQVYIWISQESLPRILLQRVWFMNKEHGYKGPYKKMQNFRPNPGSNELESLLRQSSQIICKLITYNAVVKMSPGDLLDMGW